VPFAVVFLDGGVRTAVLVIAVCQLIAEPAYVPRLLHIRRLYYPRIAFVESLSVVIGTVAAVALAWSGAGLWALLAPSVIHAVLEDLVFLGPGSAWRPCVVFNREVTRYLLGFGSRNLLAGFFDVVIEKVPELWTGIAFGTARLGIYNRAARFVSFPRRVTVDPLVSVLPARFSELKERPRDFGSTLVNALSAVGIGGGLLAIALWATAPWMIETLIGARWMPVVSPFRILVALVVLEPIRLTLSSALVALGEPGRAAWIRGSQAVVLVPAVWIGAALAELEGVAAAVVLSSAIGVVALVLQMWQRSPASAWIGRS
jgi:O-antigen/teichoic acid export membrane protein